MNSAFPQNFCNLPADRPMVCICRIKIFDAAMKVTVLLTLPALFGLWLGVGMAGIVIVGLGYGFFTPWVSTFEAFRHNENESKKFLHCIVVKFYVPFLVKTPCAFGEVHLLIF